MVRRRGREREVRRHSCAGHRRPRADGRFHRQHQGRTGDRGERRARSDRGARIAGGASVARRGGQQQALSRRAAGARGGCEAEPRAGAHPHRCAGTVRGGLAALPGRVTRAVLRAVHAARVSIAGARVRAIVPDRRQGLRDNQHAVGAPVPRRCPDARRPIRPPCAPGCHGGDARRNRGHVVFDGAEAGTIRAALETGDGRRPLRSARCG